MGEQTARTPRKKDMDQRPLQRMGNDITVATNKQMPCEAEHCERPAISLLGHRPLCLGHFITHSYDRLHECDGSPLVFSGENGSHDDDRFLRDCAEQSVHLARPLGRLNNLDRARLFDIYLWASELISRRDMFKNGTNFNPHS
jgi:hypothetical protein